MALCLWVQFFLASPVNQSLIVGNKFGMQCYFFHLGQKIFLHIHMKKGYLQEIPKVWSLFQ